LWAEEYFSGVHAAGKMDFGHSRPAGRELCEAFSTSWDCPPVFRRAVFLKNLFSGEGIWP